MSNTSSRVSAGGLAGAHPGLKNRILLTTQELRMRRSTQENFRFCCYFIEVQQTFSFPLFLLRHNKCLDASMLTTDVFELVKQFYATEIGRPNAANAVSVCPDQP